MPRASIWRGPSPPRKTLLARLTRVPYAGARLTRVGVRAITVSMSESRWLSWALEQARRNLIDLTRRNRLLHAPLSGKRPWCMALVGHEPDEVFAKLFQQENFRGYGFTARDIESDEQLRAAMPHPRVDADGGPTKRPRLQTRLPSDKLEKRLAKIFREERTLEEEQGLSTLYLALGFLRWFDSDQTEEDSWAPLLLLPVTIDLLPNLPSFIRRVCSSFAPLWGVLRTRLV